MFNKRKLVSKKSKEKELYDAFAEKMLLLCYRYLNNLMDAEEVMHNGFLKVFSHMNSFNERHERSFEFWIKKIMVNESLMFLRKGTNFNLVSINEIKESECATYETHSNALEESYLQMITDLPTGYRTVFNLFAVEGYSHKEIAELLQIAESTSRSQLTKARKLLQQKILTDGSLYA